MSSLIPWDHRNLWGPDGPDSWVIRDSNVWDSNLRSCSRSLNSERSYAANLSSGSNGWGIRVRLVDVWVVGVGSVWVVWVRVRAGVETLLVVSGSGNPELSSGPSETGAAALVRVEVQADVLLVMSFRAGSDSSKAPCSRSGSLADGREAASLLWSKIKDFIKLEFFFYF